MEALLKQLPPTLYDGDYECTLWLTLTATSVGSWQAGYSTIDGEMHDNYFAESDSPKSALMRLKVKTDNLKKIHGVTNA